MCDVLFVLYSCYKILWLSVLQNRIVGQERDLQAVKQKYEVEKTRRKSLHNALVVSCVILEYTIFILHGILDSGTDILVYVQCHCIYYVCMYVLY